MFQIGSLKCIIYLKFDKFSLSKTFLFLSEEFRRPLTYNISKKNVSVVLNMLKEMLS